MTCMRNLMEHAKDSDGNPIFPNLSALGDVCHALQNVLKNFVKEAMDATKKNVEKITSWINNSKFRTFLRFKADPCMLLVFQNVIKMFF